MSTADNRLTEQVRPDGPASRRLFDLQVALERLASLTGFVLLSVLLIPNLFVQSPAAVALQVLFLAFVLLGLRHWTVPVLLVFCGVDLFFFEPFSRDRNPPLQSVVPCVVVILMLVAASRLHGLRLASRQKLNRSFRLVKQEISQAATGEVSDVLPKTLGRLLRTFIAVAMTVTLCVVASRFILGTLPNLRNGIIADLSDQETSLYIWPGPVLLIVLLLMWIAISEGAWRLQTPGQSRLYARSQTLKLLFSDLRMIARRRIKQDRRKMQERLREERTQARQQPKPETVDGDDEPQRWL
ncbi:MAG: hypothetical protein KDA96_07850 [Planctomycetaceae bacterium]|nr:hypothetical protein [Planctomycetaceae bacterium]